MRTRDERGMDVRPGRRARAVLGTVAMLCGAAAAACGSEANGGPTPGGSGGAGGPSAEGGEPEGGGGTAAGGAAAGGAASQGGSGGSGGGAGGATGGSGEGGDPGDAGVQPSGDAASTGGAAGEGDGGCAPGTVTCEGVTEIRCTDGGLLDSRPCDWGCLPDSGCASSLQICRTGCAVTTCDVFGQCSCAGGLVTTCSNRPCEESTDCGTLGFCDPGGLCLPRALCEETTCLNGGVCVQGDADVSCRCATGYEGSRCEQDVNECAGAPCANGGTCVDGLNGYRCDCRPGYTGERCEIDVDDCATSPCANGGTCIDRVGGFSCCCPPGYSGETCAEAEPWRHIGLGDGGPYADEIGSIAVHPLRPNVIYAGDANGSTGDQLWRSDDGGSSWVSVCGRNASVTGATTIVLNPNDTRVAYFADDSGGYSFGKVDPALPEAGCGELQGLAGYGYHSAIAADPDNFSRVYGGVARASTNAVGVFVSTDTGASWTQLESTLSVDRLFVDPTNGDVLYALGLPDWGTFGEPDYSRAGVWRTADGGRFWNAILTGRGRVSTMAVSSADPARLLASTSAGGVLRSTSSGASWEGTTGLPASQVHALAFAPTDGTTAYAGVEAAGVYRSRDGGRTWEAFHQGIEAASIRAIAGNPQEARVLYAAGVGGVYRKREPGIAGACTICRDENCYEGLTCTPGEKRCELGLLASCNEEGVWSARVCGTWDTCENGECVRPQECVRLRSCCYSLATSIERTTCLNVADRGSASGCSSAGWCQ